MSFDGFISYSHAADGRLAPAVQQGLHRLAKPWHRRRALWIFRDQTGLAVTPSLWSSIQTALNSSDHFVLMASPEAAQSPWVNKEIEHWVATKPVERILPVVTDGEWRWDPATGDFHESCTAVPPALRGVFAEEPLYLDLRWARDDQQLNLRHSRFRDSIAQLAAPMHGVSKDDLEGEDVRQHRRAARLRLAAVTSLVVLSGLALLAGVFAAQNAAQANAAVLEAQAQQREALEMRGSAARFADEAKRQEALARTQEERAHEAATEADRQERVAREQKGIADGASAEAARQTGYAERAAQRAREQQRVAQQQMALAEQSAREMRRQEQLAKEQERLARKQEQLAASAAAEAKKQEEYARQAEERAEDAAAEAIRQQRNAAEQQQIAISRRLVNEAKGIVDEDPMTAVRMGVAAQHIHPAAESRREVAGLVTATRRLGSIDDVRWLEPGPGGLLATMNTYGSVSLWDVTDRARPKRLSIVNEEGSYQGDMALSRDGRTLVVTQNWVATVWDVSDPSHPEKVATLPADRQYSVTALSPDGHTLVTAVSGSLTESALIWDVSEPARPQLRSTVVSAESSYLDQVAFSWDGRTLVVDGVATEIWDVTDRRQPVLRHILPDSGPSFRLATSPTAPVLAIGNVTGDVQLWNFADPAEPSRAGRLTTDHPMALGFSPDGLLLASGDYSGKATVWVLNDLHYVPPREIGTLQSPSGLHSLAFTADSRAIVTADQTATAVVWNVAGPATPRVTADLPVRDGRLKAVWNAPDGSSAITVNRDTDAVIWDLAGKAGPSRRAAVPLLGGEVAESAAISPDGRTVAAASWTEPVRLTDLTDPDAPVPLGTFDPGFLWYGVNTFSPDGRTLVVSGPGHVQLWDVSDRKHPARTAELTFDGQEVGKATFSPDGRTLVVSVGQKFGAIVYDVTGGTPVKLSTLSGHGNEVSTITFSPDGKTVATTSPDRIAVLWDVTDRAAPRRLTTLNGHSGPVTAVAFSRDGRTLATAATESWALLWDVSQPAKPVRLARVQLGAGRQPAAMTFGPDDRTLTVGTELGRSAAHLTWWDLTELIGLRADPAAFGCTVVGRGLTEAEWERYVPELKYRKTCD